MNVTLCIVGSRVEADMVVAMLSSHGLTGFVSADDAGDGVRKLDTHGGPRP